MSLYFEASSILSNEDKRGGSLKSRVFGQKELKNPPAKVYALLVESLKWSPFLKEVIERSEILKVEKKLTPALAVLLVHDLLLAKGGVAAPKNHALRLSVEKHKARLSAEFTRCRIRQGFGSVEAFRDHINGVTRLTTGGTDDTYRHPRWVRVNTLRSSLNEQLSTTFEGYNSVTKLEQVLQASSKERWYYVDEHIPDLIALPFGHDLSKTNAYTQGAIIFQDKASCFPAYLLDPGSIDGDTIDTCAAPGNKTTHLAALLHEAQSTNERNRQIFAFERNPHRSLILKKMVARAGGDQLITVHGSTDFLSVNADDARFSGVEGLLLDPSCSGTGIVGRDDEPTMHLPVTPDARSSGPSKKRKRSAKEPVLPAQSNGEVEENEVDGEGKDLQERLRMLSDFQVQLVQHAMRFPSARRITYSTCSIHAEENELVVVRALTSPTALEHGWRVLRRDEQPIGMQKWAVRGVKPDDTMADEIADACIRCEKGTREGTMGFFVVAFVRDTTFTTVGGRIAQKGDGDVRVGLNFQAPAKDSAETDEDEWEGFSDDED